jgi:hypothetical protein
VAGVTHLKNTTNTGSKMKDIKKLIDPSETHHKHRLKDEGH